eukprot:TRINITY_DN14428_c0_g2_i1.p1 TRINITY_DN14428_c0_g2~~TRINITY_DN14428_c0_g2_i1.p1  ORF type:complete len:545 (-),score=64.84 TRINITY_DN14428_c0_g2_i1:376-1833(-)
MQHNTLSDSQLPALFGYYKEFMGNLYPVRINEVFLRDKLFVSKGIMMFDEEYLCWFYRDDEKQLQGPFSAKQLLKWDQKISPRRILKYENLGVWITASFFFKVARRKLPPPINHNLHHGVQPMDCEEVVKTVHVLRSQLSHIEAMEIDEFNDIQEILIDIEMKDADLLVIYGVIDTNVFISNLEDLKQLFLDLKENDVQNLKFLIPWIVLCELDGLKKREGDDVGKLARDATHFLKENMSLDFILLQGISDYRKIRGKSDDESNDNKIIQTCLYYQESFQDKEIQSQVVLLTNDVNLTVKSKACEILAKIFKSLKYSDIHEFCHQVTSEEIEQQSSKKQNIGRKISNNSSCDQTAVDCKQRLDDQRFQNEFKENNQNHKTVTNNIDEIFVQNFDSKHDVTMTDDSTQLVTHTAQIQPNDRQQQEQKPYSKDSFRYGQHRQQSSSKTTINDQYAVAEIEALQKIVGKFNATQSDYQALLEWKHKQF